jgi:hypothetical protein
MRIHAARQARMPAPPTTDTTAVITRTRGHVDAEVAGDAGRRRNPRPAR